MEYKKAVCMQMKNSNFVKFKKSPLSYTSLKNKATLRMVS